MIQQQIIGGDAEDAAQLEDFFRIGEGLVGFPTADGPPGDAQLSRQGLLGEAGVAAPEGDLFSDGHGDNSFL